MVSDAIKKYSGSHRRGDGGIYLVVADNTEEFGVALRYGALLAKSNRGHLAILQTIDHGDVQHWGNVEDMMKKELREQAEKTVGSVASRAEEISGVIPSVYIRDGGTADAIIEVINEDAAIRMLILGGGTNPAGPGPLVSYFTGKGLGRLRIPVVVVPGHLDPQKIDAIT